MRLIVNNEDLDIDKNQIITFKRTQKLNGLQESYSFTNNFKLDKSSNNLRILNSNYLPTTKSKNMAQSIDCDVVLNDTIYLKKQQLKIKKDSESFDTYIVFSDSFLLTKAKELLMKDIDFGTTYDKSNIYAFTGKHSPTGNISTACISAQSESGLIVLEESNILINIKFAIETIFQKLGYTLSGDYLLDTYFPLYYFSSDVGWYGADGTAQFSDSLTAFDFIESVLETFNGYIDVLDSTRYASFNLWNNIETLKDNFIDYSEYFDKEKQYVSEEGLAKKNIVKYSEGLEFYNSFFSNNKSLEKEKVYLNSDFGAGNMRLFSDQEIKEDGTIPLREVGEITEPKKLNLYRFETEIKSYFVYLNGIKDTVIMYTAVSPNILEIYQRFHKSYTDNIEQPVIAELDFKYNALLLNDFNMQQVFFIKQLSSYWLPLEINFSTKKDGISIKSLLIQKTAVDIPIVYDLNLSIGVNEEVYVVDQSLLYASVNISPASSITIQNADLTKNFIFVNGIEVLAFPVTFDITTQFEIRVANKEVVSNISNTNIVFFYTSLEGGVSRLANIKVTNIGLTNYISEFQSNLDIEEEVLFEEVNDYRYSINLTTLVENPFNIKNSLQPLEVNIPNFNLPVFKVLEIQKDGWITFDLIIEKLIVTVRNQSNEFSTSASHEVRFNIFSTRHAYWNMYLTSAYSQNGYNTVTQEVDNIAIQYSRMAYAGEIIYIQIEGYLYGSRNSPVDGKLAFTNLNWKFTKTE